MKKIVIASDSFKGCLTSAEAGAFMSEGVRMSVPGADVVVIPLADGGEGTMDAFEACHGGMRRRFRVHDPLMRLREAEALMLANGDIVVESAACIGLPLLAASDRSAMLTSSYGLGELIRMTARETHGRILVGLGGTATCDGGIGALQALGARIFLTDGSLLQRAACGADMSSVGRIDLSDLEKIRVELLIDAEIPLCGPAGAALRYAAQKGASGAEQAQLDEGLYNVMILLERASGRGLVECYSAGAAGGLGMALRLAFGAPEQSGISRLLAETGFEKVVADADVVLTGEGRSDAQTLQGKAPAGVMRAALEAGVPCALLAGKVDNREALLAAGFSSVVDINASLPASDACCPEVAGERLKKSAAGIIARMKEKNSRRNS